MVVCPDCGRPVRYITAPRGEEIFKVDMEPETLIGEKGRVLTGFRVHSCQGPGPGAGEKENGKEKSG
jgi:hypothetical protein